MGIWGNIVETVTCSSQARVFYLFSLRTELVFNIVGHHIDYNVSSRRVDTECERLPLEGILRTKPYSITTRRRLVPCALPLYT